MSLPMTAKGTTECGFKEYECKALARHDHEWKRKKTEMKNPKWATTKVGMKKHLKLCLKYKADQAYGISWGNTWNLGLWLGSTICQLQLKEIWVILSLSCTPILKILLFQIRYCWDNIFPNHLSLLKHNWRKLQALIYIEPGQGQKLENYLWGQTAGCLNLALLHRDLG